MPTLLALVCGALIGFCLGALGGGGGILVWPALVFGLDSSPLEAAVLAKVIVGLCSAFAAVLHWRRGNVRFRAALTLAAIGIPGAWLGGRIVELARLDSETARRLMIGVLTVLMIVIALLMLKKGLGNRRRESQQAGTHVSAQPLNSVLGSILFVVSGFVIGFLTGFLGVGGGFLIVPTLVLVCRLPMKPAAGTSLVVIAINCGVGIAASNTGEVRWHIAVLFAAAAIVASFVAVKTVQQTRQSTLQIAFSGLIVVLAVLMIWKGV